MNENSVSVPYDEVAQRLYRSDPALAVNVLNECLADGAINEFLIALRQIAQAFGGVQNVARLGGLHEKTLYKTLGPDGNPTLKTLLALARVMNMRLAFLPKSEGMCHETAAS